MPLLRRSGCHDQKRPISSHARKRESGGGRPPYQPVFITETSQQIPAFAGMTKSSSVSRFLHTLFRGTNMSEQRQAGSNRGAPVIPSMPRDTAGNRAEQATAEPRPDPEKSAPLCRGLRTLFSTCFIVIGLPRAEIPGPSRCCRISSGTRPGREGIP